MPSCSWRTTWYGPATRVTKYVDSGCVVASSHTPGSACSAWPLPTTTQSSGARTWKVYGAFRSGWSKQAKMLGAASRNDIA